MPQKSKKARWILWKNHLSNFHRKNNNTVQIKTLKTFENTNQKIETEVFIFDNIMANKRGKNSTSFPIVKTSQTWPRPTKEIENFEYKNHRSTQRSNRQNIDYSMKNREIGDQSINQSQL